MQFNIFMSQAAHLLRANIHTLDFSADAVLEEECEFVLDHGLVALAKSCLLNL